MILTWLMIRFALSFSMGKIHSWGPFTKCGARLNSCLILGPFFGMPPPGALPYIEFLLFANKNIR
jgi:hypothetical protein